jgi:hypothetical protein
MNNNLKRNKMKNIHVLPTKPNDETGGGIWIEKTRDWCNIYIANDEEIKEGNWRLDIRNGNVYKSNKADSELYDNTFRKKILLTTDQDLIKDGVQAIDDEFLEWFVKNPNCESVEVERTVNDYWHKLQLHYEFKYKIIIPQEEPKQETLTYTEAAKKEERIFNSTMIKQETLEEVAERLKGKELFKESNDRARKILSEIKSLPIQERSYSEEEVLELLNNREQYLIESVGEFYQSNLEWFNKFKKK